MSVNSKQFNRNVPLYEEVEQHIRNAQRLRSDAIADSVQRLVAGISAGARHLRALVVGGLRVQGQKDAAPRFGWSPTASVAGQSARCK